MGEKYKSEVRVECLMLYLMKVKGYISMEVVNGMAYSKSELNGLEVNSSDSKLIIGLYK